MGYERGQHYNGGGQPPFCTEFWKKAGKKIPYTTRLQSPGREEILQISTTNRRQNTDKHKTDREGERDREREQQYYYKGRNINVKETKTSGLRHRVNVR